MQRLALSLAAISASLFVCAVATLLPSRVKAFETEPGGVTVPGSSTQFQDPDDKPLPAPLTLLKLEEDGTISQTEMNLQTRPGVGLHL
jgi:hypothetical protein